MSDSWYLFYRWGEMLDDPGPDETEKESDNDYIPNNHNQA
jgi:hypothetical protein